ncbi:LacI family DNA-binding transcriptional regulator [Microbacterium sp. NPDC089318]
MVSTIEDVARLAGVARGTVSNVLNRPEKVAEATRERVVKAMAKLGYVPNESARVLAGGPGRFVGALVHDAANPYFAEIVRAVEGAALASRYTVTTISTGTDTDRERAAVELLMQQRAQGVLMTPATIGPVDVARLRSIGTSVVLVDSWSESECSVSVDDLEGGRLAGRHLFRAGISRYVFVGAPSLAAQHRDRLAGFEAELRERDRAADIRVIDVERNDIPAGRGAATQVAQLARDARIAVFTGSDLIAIGLGFAFPEHSLRVPEDIILCGYDDIEFSRYLSIPLTSIAQPMNAIGEAAFNLLVDEMTNDDHLHSQVRFTPQLIPRESTR